LYPGKEQEESYPIYTFLALVFSAQIALNPIITPAQAQVITDNTPTHQGDNYIEAPLIVETVVTPRASTIAVPNSRFPYGYCTWYVASRTTIPWSGNARDWLVNAKAYHYSTGEEPQTGSILVSNDGPLGHVSLVESVNSSTQTFTISEMNYRGYGIISDRTLPFDSRNIKGFIYLN
jgi:surface antigen